MTGKLRNFHCFLGRIKVLQIPWGPPCLLDIHNEILMDKTHFWDILPKKVGFFFFKVRGGRQSVDETRLVRS